MTDGFITGGFAPSRHCPVPIRLDHLPGSGFALLTRFEQTIEVQP
jgi:hypothetical protein